MPLTTAQQEQKDSAIASDKAALVSQLVGASSGLQNALTAVSNVLIAMQSRGYVLGGDEAIADADLIDRQFTAAELHEVLELFGELQKLSAGQATTAKAWGLINAKVAG